MESAVKNKIKGYLKSSIEDAVSEGRFNLNEIPPVFLEVPREENHGDFSSNVSFLLAKDAGKSPAEIACIILEYLGKRIDREPLVQKTETAGGGFINFFISSEAYYPVLIKIIEHGDGYGNSNLGNGEKILVEFVSANPTGPLHVGHARNAVVGDVLSNILKTSGFNVRKEYYLNDTGNQVEALGKSLRQRYMELTGASENEDIEYGGEYLIELAKELPEKDAGGEIPDTAVFRDYAVKRIREDIQKDLEDFGITFDSWFSEKSLHDGGDIEKIIKLLDEKGCIQKNDGALWFKSKQFGDEKDRVIVKSDGSATYLAPDIAYHYNKLKRGFSRLINVWGADHHGYIPRIKASLTALGFHSGVLDIVLIQLVKLGRGGKPVSMSTRAGNFVTMRELIDEVGSDNVRFFMLMRRSDAQLEFDLELAKKQSMENPVYYLQYAHARICSLFSYAAEKGFKLGKIDEVKVELLIEKEEISLIKVLSLYPGVVEGSAKNLEPHRLTAYLQEAASNLHNFYDRLRVVEEDEEKARPRLLLIRAAQIVLQNGLGLLGISCPDRM